MAVKLRSFSPCMVLRSPTTMSCASLRMSPAVSGNDLSLLIVRLKRAPTQGRPFPFGFHHHLIHRKEAHYSGERVPEEKTFYEDVAKDLQPADEIVLIGHGTGKSSSVDYLAEYLEKHHHNISQHVIATETADLSALTEPEIEVIAKRHMIAVVA